MKKSSSLLGTFRRHFKRPVALALALFFPLWTVQVRGATLFYQGSDGEWDEVTSNWSVTSTPFNGVMWNNSAGNSAYFGGTAGVVGLNADITATGLIFNPASGSYTISSNFMSGPDHTLTLVAPTGLNSPVINVASFARAEIDAVVAGTSGLTKTGNGTLVLGNSGNSFSGDVVINGGALVITDQAQLGSGTTTISVNGLANTGNPGYSGGILVVQGGLNGITIDRPVSVSGRGQGAANASAGLVSIGSNTFTGTIVVGNTGSEGRMLATNGITTIAGGLQLGTGAAETFFGNGNFIVSGIVTGYDVTTLDRFIKSGTTIASTMWLQNPDNNFAQPVRIDSGTVRVTDNADLGTSYSTRAVDFNGGWLEVHTDTPNFETRNVYNRGTNGYILADRALGGTGLNQTVQFGNFDADNATLNIYSRDGYNVGLNGSLGAGTTMQWSSAGNLTFNSNLNGTLILDMNIAHDSESTQRVVSFNGNGETVLTGAFLANGASNAFGVAKGGTGQMTLTDLTLASTSTGTTTINGGTLVFGSANALPTGQILIGNATTISGALTYVGAGETLTNDIKLNTTTANVFINASGSGALILSSAFTTVAGTKTLVLGGTNTDDNSILSALPDGAATSLQKVGAGTWLLSGANAITGSTTISNGILKLQDTAAGGMSTNVLPEAGAIVFNVDVSTNSAGGTLQYLGAEALDSFENVGALTATAGAGTVMVTAGSGGTASLIFSSLGTITAGSGINFVTGPDASVFISGATDTNGILDAHLFYNGADFASVSGVVGAAVYTVVADGSGLVAGNTAPYLVNTLGIAAQATATINAGIKFDDSVDLTLAPAAILTIQNGAATASGGILVTGGSSVTINGGAGSGITSGGSADLVFRTDTSADTLTLETPILSTSTGGWTKLGAGTLLLGVANANTTAGYVNIDEGTVSLSVGATLGANAINVNLRQGGTLDLNGANLGTAASSTGAVNILNGAGTITNSAVGTTSTLRIGDSSGGANFTGLIQDGAGQVSLVKAGSGTIGLAGVNTFTGPVTLVGGNLDVPLLASIGQASGIGMGDATSDATNAASLVFSGGSLRYIGTYTAEMISATQTPSVSIDRLFTLAGNGGIYSYGSYGNLVQTRAGNNAALVFANTAPVAFTGTGARTLTLGGDSYGDNQINLQLIDNPLDPSPTTTGLFSLSSSGGLWILGNNTNAYSGATTITAGALRAVDGASLPTTSALRLGGGVFQTSGFFTRTVGTGPGQVAWSDVTGTGTNLNGGFAASIAPLTVNLGGAGDTVSWGTGGIGNGTGTLILSSNTAWADVNFVNPIDLNATTGTVTRTIQVDDNTYTGLDFATVSGVISNSGAGTAILSKTGSGNLILGDANTYNGNTTLTNGATVVTSIGAEGVTSSSFGTNVGGGSLLLGSGGNTVSLLYVGAGETVTRPISLVTSTGTVQIDSSGSGALVITNITDNATGQFSFNIRGTNGDMNTIPADLADSTAGSYAFRVLKTDGGVWALTGNNTHTGGTRIDSGLLGLGPNALGVVDPTGLTVNAVSNSTTVTTTSTADLKVGMFIDGLGFGYGDYITGITNGTTFTISTARTVAAGTPVYLGGLLVSNGEIFATDPGGLTISQPILINNNTAIVFGGSNAITVDGDVVKLAGTSDQTFSNNLDNGAVLTINGDFVNLQNAAATRNINVRGYGSTIWNGVLQNNSSTSLTRFDIRIANDASFTLGGANTLTGGFLLGQGTLIVNNAGGLGPTANSLIFDGGVLTSNVDLSGADKVTNAVFLQGDPFTVSGSNNIEFGGTVTPNNSRSLVNNLNPGSKFTISGPVVNTSTTGYTLTLFGSGDTVISGNVSAGSGALGLQYAGTGSLLLTGVNTTTGTLTVSRGTVTLSGTTGGSVNAVAGVTLNTGGTLVLDNSGGNNASGRVASRLFTFNGGALSMIGNNTTATAGNATVNGVQGFINMSGAGSNTLSFATANFANSGSSWDLTGVIDLGGANKIKITAYQQGGVAYSNTILPRIVITNDFAAYDSTNGVVPFTAYTTSTDLDGAANADTMNVTGAANLTLSRTLNALKINGSGISVTSTGNRLLTLTTGSVISTGGDNTLAISQVTLNGQSGYFQVQDGTTLHVTSTLLNGQLSKVGDGTLSLESTSFYNSTTNVMGGTLVLDAGNNTVFPAVNTFNIAFGATVDLHGTTQYVGNLTGAGSLPNSAGTLTNTLSGPANLSTFVTNGGGGYGGLITGNISLGRVAGGTLTLEMAQTYTGATYLLSGATNLENDATLLTTSAIVINGSASLSLNNNSNLQTQINDRIGDTIPITLNAGTIAANGRVDTAATETLGDITLEAGANTIQSATGGTGTAGGFTSQTLTIASLTRDPGSTVNFTNSTALGAIGNQPSILFTTPLVTTGDGVLGPWAILNYSDYAAYNTANGIGMVGNGGYAGYTATFASGNITTVGTDSTVPFSTTLPAGTTTTGMLHIGGSFYNDIAFTNNGDVLNLDMGGILRSNNPFETTIGTPDIRGVITAGGTETSGPLATGGVRELIIYNYNASNPTFTNPNSAGGIVAGSPVVIMNSTVGIQPGMTLSNANFPTGTTVVSVDSLLQMTLSNNAITSAQNQTFTGNSFVAGETTTGSAQVTMNSTVGITPGMTIVNPGFGGGVTTKGSAVVTVSSTVGIQPGMTLTNGYFPAGTTVVSVDSSTKITLSQPATTAGTSQSFYGVGIATGTYVVSVDSPTQVTLSQAANATGTASAFNVGVSNMIINSVIADNGFGNMVEMVKSGTGVLNLSANNTYSGGTIVNQGTLNLIGSGVVLPAGGLTINNAVVAMNTNNGQIDPTNDVTLVGSSILTLAGSLGQDNTLHSITFNNNGGGGTTTVTNQTNSILTLTSSAPVTVTSSNTVVPSITGGYLAINSGDDTFSIQGPTLNGVLYNGIVASLYITSIITGTGARIIKTDTGLLQLNNQNTFTGGIDVQGGGLILSGSSTSTIPNTLVSGPLGTGPVSFADGTTLLADNNSRTVANAMSFAGNPIFNNTSTSLPTLALNGALNFATLTTTGLVVNIPTPDLNVYLGGHIANMNTVTSIGGVAGANTITKSGPGNITGLNITGIGSTAPIDIGAIDNGTSFSLLDDGDLTASLQTINLGAITWEPAISGTVLSLTIGRSSTGDGTYYPLALNKTIAPASFSSSLLPNGLTLTNNSNYGLLLVDDIAFNTVATNQGPTFSVSGGSTSLQVDGLTLSGVLTGGPTGDAAVVLSKIGGGVLSLTNPGNTFGGSGSIIDITAGIIAAPNDGALGDASNIIRLSGNNLGYGFRATGTFATDRTFNLNSAAGEIEVTQGNTLTLNHAFTFTGANDALRKYDFGTLVLTQPETDWNGVMLVQQGVLQISDGAQLGNGSSMTDLTPTAGATGTTTLTLSGGTSSYSVGQVVSGTGIAADTYITGVTSTTITLSLATTAANPSITTAAGGVYLSNVGSAIELTGDVTVADNIFVNASNNATNNGINGGGAIRSTAGTNTISGLITIATTTVDSNVRAVTLTADSGATLDITGGVLGQVGTAGASRHSWVGLGGDGTINITTTGFTNTGTLGIFQLNKFGTGLLNIQVANAFSGRDVIIKQGMLSFNGAGSLVSLGSGQGSTRNIYLLNAGTLVLDNTGTDVTNRLGGTTAVLTSWGGHFQILGNSGATTAETIGAMTLNAGASVFTLDADPAAQLNFTTAAVTRNGGSTLLILADNLGSAAGNGVATIQGSTATYTFTGELGATDTTKKAILPWAVGSTGLGGTGLGFVTADSAASGANAGTNRLRLLNPVTEQVSTLATAGTNVNLAGAAGIALSLSINSLQLGSGADITLAGSDSTALTLESGGLLVTDGSSTISGVGRLVTASNRELIVYAQGDLTVDVPLSNFTGGLTKSGDGTLTLGATNYYGGTLTINQGTVKLAAGDQTILPNQTLQILGGFLDLNGTVQNFNNVQAGAGTLAVNDLYAQNTGGTVINTSGSQATLTMSTGGGSFRGAIGDSDPLDSNIAVARSTAAGNTSDWNLYSDNTYTGPTLLSGGRVLVYDNGALSHTSSVEVSNSTLYFASSNTTVETANNTDRINDAAPILLNGSLFQYRSRASLYTTEAMGAVTLGFGSSIIDFAEPGSNVNQSDITWASFAQAPGEHGTVRFLNIDGNISALQRLFINNLNGVDTTNVGDGLTNNIIGGWATFEREFATYTPGMGVAGLANNGAAGYSPFVDPNLGSATDNIRIILPAAGSTTTLTADRTLYTLNLQTPTTSTANSTLDLGGHTLTLASGGIILSPLATTASSNSITVQNGSLTAGTTSSPTDFYLHALSWYNNQADNTGNADVTISAKIVDNTAGGSVSLVIDANNGRGTLGATNDVFLTASNTYTGGTFVNSGRVDLNTVGANGTTVTAIGSGDLTIAGGYSGNAGIFLDRNTRVLLGADSEIANTATVTVMGGGTLDLNNFNQTLGGLVFNNNGGDTPTVTAGTGMLTLTGDISAIGQNLGSVSTITGTGTGQISLGGHTRTVTVDSVQWNGAILNPLQPNLLISGTLTGTGSEGIIKAGSGLLQLSGQNTFSGDVALQSGGIIIGASSTPPLGGGVLSSGPLGTGSLLVASGASLLVDNASRSVANDISFAGSPIFVSTGTSTVTMTLNGAITLPNGAVSVSVTTPGLTVILGNIPNIASITSITNTGLGTLIFNTTGYTGDLYATALGNPNSISLLNDGDGTGRQETIPLGNVSFDAGIVPTVVVGRAGNSYPYNQAQNGIIAPASFTQFGTSVAAFSAGLTVTNNNAYGLLLSDAATLASPTFSVATATISTLTQGLYLDGKLSGTGFTKTGNGTLALGNADNDFTGSIVINQGVVSVAADGALGNATNKIVLSPTVASSTATLRATDNITTSRVVQLANTANTRAIEVSQDKTLTLNSAFDLNGGAGATAVLVKNDNGTLVLAADNSGWTGGLTINGGAVLLTNANGAGSGAITIAPASAAQGAALQLSNDITVANVINLQGAGNQALGGINTGGQLESVSGTNTTIGSLVMIFDSVIGADAGSTLNINGGINNTTTSARALTFAGDGTINLNSDTTSSTSTANQYYSIIKRGAGTLNVTTELSMIPSSNLTFYSGTVSLNGGGILSGGNSITLTVNANARVVLDNSMTNVANRFGGRPVALTGGSLVFDGQDDATSTETLGALTISRPGATITSTAGAGAGANVLTFSKVTVNSDSTVNFIGSDLGATNKIIFTAAPTMTTGIIARATVNGADFATYAAGTGIAAFAGYNTSNDINTGTSTITFDLTTNTAMTSSRTANAIKFSDASGSAITIPSTGSTGSVGSSTPYTLTLSSGGILATGGGENAINAAALLFGAVQAVFHIDTDTSLTITSALTGTAGLVKDGPGTLILSQTPNPIINRSPNTLTNNDSILEGTLVINGGNNTLPANQFMILGPNGTLDLNGNSQMVRGLLTDSLVENGGGIVTGGSDPNSTLVMNQDNTARNWAGVLTGALSFMRTGDNTLTVYSSNDYTGTTYISGGGTTLVDGGALTQTTDIEIVYATLTLNNAGTKTMVDRVNDTASITMRGGTISFAGRAQYDSTEKFGPLTLIRGNNYIANSVTGTGVNSTDLSFDALLRDSTSTATLRFNNASTDGQLGNGTRTTFSQINGQATTSLGDGLVNNIIGAWAIVDYDYATYTPVLGVGALNAVGFAAADGTTFLGALAVTDNIRFGTTGTTTLTTDVDINTLTFSKPNTATTLDLGGKTLTLAGGGLLFGMSTDNVNINVTNGFITAGSGGPADLYITQANFGGTNRTVSIDAIIKDNGGPLRLIKSSGDTGVSVMTLNGANTYTGGTYVNNGTLIIGSGGYIPLAATPANGLVLNGNNSTVTQTTAGTIDPGNYVTINGNATLNLYGDNTLAGLIFTDDGGGSGVPQVLSNFGVLTLTGGIVSTSANPASVSTVGGRVDFGSSMKTINISATTFNGQEVAALLSDFNLQGVLGSAGGITKVGNGVLQFGQDIYTGPTIVHEGRIQVNANGAGARFSDLTLEGGTGLNINGFNATFGSLSGSGFVMNSGTATASLTVGFDGNDSTFSGLFYRFNDATPNNLGLIKIGTGTLTFDADGSGSTVTGSLSISRGAVTFSGNGTSSFPYATIQVNEGGVLNLDNTAVNNNARLRNGGVAMNGGQLNYLGTDATASAETSTGALTIGPSASVINLTNGAGGTAFLKFGSLSQQGGGTAVVIGANLGTDTKLLFNSTPALVGGIIARIAVGTDFATYDSTQGVTAYTGYATPSSVNGAAGTATIKVDGTTTARDINLGRTINAVDIIDDDVTIGSNGLLLPTQGWTITSGGILVNGDNATLSTPVLALGAEGIFRVNGSSLNITSMITGSSGITKTGPGNITLSSPQAYTGQTALSLGTMTLDGGRNTILDYPTLTVTASNLQLNGGTLDLNGNDQVFGALLNSNTLAYAGGVITNSSATPAIFSSATTTSAVFGAQLTGNLSFTKSGNATLAFPDVQSYTGATIVRSGTLMLQDKAVLYSGVTDLSRASITMNYATLNLNDANLNAMDNLAPARLPAGAPVFLNGGTLMMTGGGTVDSSVRIDSLTVLNGQSNITLVPFLNSGSTVLIDIGNFTIDPSNGSVTSFVGYTSNNGLAASTIGGQGTSINGNVLLHQINGAPGPVSYVLAATTVAGSDTVTVPSTAGLAVGMVVTGTNIPAGETVASIVDGTTFTLSSGTGVVTGTSINLNVNSGLTNNLIGGWAVADGNSFATYVTGAGVSVMGQTTQGVVAPGYDGSNIAAATVTATQNISDASTSRTLLTGVTSAYSLRTTGSAATYTIPAASSLSLGVGWITNGNVAYAIAGKDRTSTLTSPNPLLYIYVNQNTTSINANITGDISLVKSGGATLTLNNSASVGNNTYTGSTYVNAGTLNLSAAASNIVVIPGDLVINNATVTMVTNAGQIAADSSVTIHGGGVLTLVGSNTFSSLNFYDEGGNGTPTAHVSTSLTLTAATAIKASNDNLSYTPTIADTKLMLSNASPVIEVDAGLAPNGLIITAPLDTNGGGVITKTGEGALILNGGTAHVLTGGLDVQAGTLVFDNTAATNPYGTGTIILENGVAIRSGTAGRTVANAISVLGNLTFGTFATDNATANASNNLTLSGTVALGGTDQTMAVNGLLMIGTISGQLTGGNGLTKDGLGTLVLSKNTNNYGGPTTVSGGILQLGAAGVIPDGSALTVTSGGFVNVNGFSETIGSLAGDGEVINAGAAATLTTGGDNSSTTFSGSITNQASALSLVKTGAGTQILSGANSYTGTTTVSAGMLQFAQETSFYNNTPASWTATNFIVNSGTTAAFNVGGAGEFTASDIATILPLGTGAGGFLNGAVIGLDTSNATGGSFTYPTAINDTNAGANVISLTKLGGGALVLTGDNTYTGPTHVTAGILAVGDGTSGALSGEGAVTVVQAPSTILNAPVLSGGSGGNAGVGVITGSTIIGDIGSSANAGVIAPGVGAPGISNQTLVFTASGAALTVATGSQMQLSITTPTVTADSGILAAINGSTYTDAADYITHNTPSWTTGAPATVGEHDFIRLDNGALSLGARMDGTLGDGTVAVIDNGYLSGAQAGDVFNLLDWQGVMGGTFATTGFTQGGAFGDIDLPMLNTGLFWDTSAFVTSGVLVVVPEPTRMLLIMAGLLSLLGRRRRRRREEIL